MKAIRPLLIAASVLAAGSTLAATVPVLNFPAPGLPYSDTYGDFESYSMPILDWASTSSGGPSYMFNTANTIQKALVIGTGSQTNNQDLVLVGAVQNGFDFPNKQQNDPDYSTDTDYSTTTANGGPTWDISLAALRDYLTFDGVQHDMVAYFNNNQKGDDNNLWAWAQVSLVGSGSTQTFTLQDIGSGSPTGFDHGDYVLSGGPITLCYNETFTKSTTAANVVACDGNEIGTHTFEHNLGQNDVSYAIFSSALNDLIWSDDYTTMKVRVDFLDLNNGFENLFIGAACVGPNGCVPDEVPEPATLALFGIGLIGLLALGRRRQSQPEV